MNYQETNDRTLLFTAVQPVIDVLVVPARVAELDTSNQYFFSSSLFFSFFFLVTEQCVLKFNNRIARRESLHGTFSFANGEGPYERTPSRLPRRESVQVTRSQQMAGFGNVVMRIVPLATAFDPAILPRDTRVIAATTKFRSRGNVARKFAGDRE